MKKRPKAMPVTWANFPAISHAAWCKAVGMKSFGYADISHAMGISVEQATRIVRAWIREGALDEVKAPAGAARALWRCKEDFVRIEPLRPRSPEENMWTAMRRLPAFSPTDLAAHATSETVEVTPAMAAEYCRALLDAKFLVVARRAAPAMQREAIYRAVGITGVNAPLIKRIRAVCDPNTGEVHVIGRVPGAE